MKLFLHMGMTKTGTTSLQNCLADNRELLAANGVLYPKLDSHESQHSFFLYDDVPELRDLQYRDNALFEEQVASQNWNSVILSGEAISLLNTAALAKRIKQFSRFDIQPVLVVREWPGFLNSRWHQDVQRRDAWSFSKYIQHLENIDFKHEDCDYNLPCLRIMASFERPPILIGYGAAMDRDTSIIPAVLSALSIPENLIPIAPKKVQLNSQPTLVQTERIRLVNQIYCSEKGLPEVELFHSRPTLSRPTSCFDFGPRVYRATNESPELWSIVDQTVRGAVRSLSLDNIRKSYKDWHANFHAIFGKFFIDDMYLKTANELGSWNIQTVEELTPDDFPSLAIEDIKTQVDSFG